jgi:hypothetical protein
LLDIALVNFFQPLHCEYGPFAPAGHMSHSCRSRIVGDSLPEDSTKDSHKHIREGCDFNRSAIRIKELRLQPLRATPQLFLLITRRQKDCPRESFLIPPAPRDHARRLIGPFIPRV